MAEISVSPTGDDVFEVTVSSGGSTTSHRVTADAATIARLAPGADARDFVEASFRFLLDRESKESILSSFDLPAIGRYFPEYRSSIGAYLSDRD